MTERLRRALYRVDSARMPRSRDCLDRRRTAAHRERLRRVLHALPDASDPRERLAHAAASDAAHDRAHRSAPRGQRPAPSLRPRRVVPDERRRHPPCFHSERTLPLRDLAGPTRVRAVAAIVARAVEQSRRRLTPGRPERPIDFSVATGSRFGGPIRRGRTKRAFRGRWSRN